MAKNKLNTLLHYKDVIALNQKHFIPGISTYSGIFRKYVYPVYKMDYKTFMRIINFVGLEDKIEEELKKKTI